MSIEPQPKEPNPVWNLFAWLFWAAAVVLLGLAFFMSNTVILSGETSSIIGVNEVINAAKAQRQDMFLMAGSASAIVGTLCFGFGAMIEALKKLR